MGHPTKPSFYIGCLNAINTLSLLFIGAVAFLSFAISDPPTRYSDKQMAHVYITVTGFTLLWSQALLSVNPHKGFEHNFVYPKKSQKYWIIQIIGHATAFSGTYLGISAVSESTNHIINGVSVQHLGTTHGVMGLVIMLLTAVNLVGASVNLIMEQPFNSFTNTLYVVVGTVTLIMAYIVICMQFGNATTPLGYDSSVIPMGITFASLSIVALLVMMGTRVIKTASSSYKTFN